MTFETGMFDIFQPTFDDKNKSNYTNVYKKYAAQAVPAPQNFSKILFLSYLCMYILLCLRRRYFREGF